MKNKIIFGIGCLVLASFFFSCQQAENKEEASPKTEENWKADMYEPSELVMVMRQMYDDNLKLKESVHQGIVPAAMPENYREILTAKSTNPGELKPSYFAMANTYLDNYEAMTKSDPQTVEAKYNILISSCISCHKNYCMGPIPKIEKLYLK